MKPKDRILNTQVDGLVEAVLTQEEQEALTPDGVIELLKEGSARFSSGEVTLRNHKEQVRKAASGQFPKAIVLSCVDSRVPGRGRFRPRHRRYVRGSCGWQLRELRHSR